jgi:hypothetical protein
MPDPIPPPWSDRLRRHLHPHESLTVSAARAIDERMNEENLPLDALIDLLVGYSRIIHQWPQPVHMPAFHEWATRSPLDHAKSPPLMRAVLRRG